MIVLTIKTNNEEEVVSLLEEYNYEYFTRSVSYNTGTTQEIEGEHLPLLESYEGVFTKILIPDDVITIDLLSDYQVTNDTNPSLSDLNWSVSGLSDYNEQS